MSWFWEVLPLLGYAGWYLVGRSQGRRAERRRWATFGEPEPDDIVVRITASGFATIECRLHREHVLLPVATGEIGKALVAHVREAHPRATVSWSGRQGL